jgi:hypothetical protein
VAAFRHLDGDDHAREFQQNKKTESGRANFFLAFNINEMPAAQALP